MSNRYRRDNQPMRMTWNQDLGAFEADATAPESGFDPAVGPAGPAGVCSLRSMGGSVSLDTITGRVVSLWFDTDPDDATRRLISLVIDETDRELLDSPAGSADFELPITPAGERTDVLLLATLLDAERNVPMNAHSPAAFLLHTELAAVQERLRGQGHQLLDSTELRRHLDEAENIAECFGGRSMTSRLPSGVSFDLDVVREALESILYSLQGLIEPTTATFNLLADTIFELRREASGTDAMLGGSVMAVEPVAFPTLFAQPKLTIISNPHEPEAGAITLHVLLGEDGKFALGELAARQIALRADGGRCETSGSWCTVTQPMSGSTRSHLGLRVTALKGGEPVGAAPCSTYTGMMTATFAVSAAPDELAITAAPLNLDVHAHLSSFEATDRLCRAAHWARWVGDTRAASWFAHGAVSWYELGQVFRAGWAWHLADKELVERLFCERKGGGAASVAVAALRAVAGSGDVPLEHLTPTVVPAWVHAVDLQRYAQGLNATGNVLAAR